MRKSEKVMDIIKSAEISGNHPTKRYNLGRLQRFLEVPDLLEHQTRSYKWFKEQGIKKLFSQVFPIQDEKGLYVLDFQNCHFGEPRYNWQTCKERGLTYHSPLYLDLKLKTEEGEIIQQTVYAGDVPEMTERGTFIINGAERVVVSQMIRSPGLYFKCVSDAQGRDLYHARITPAHGSWLEIGFDSGMYMYGRIGKTRRFPITALLTAIGFEERTEKTLSRDEYILEVENEPASLIGWLPPVSLWDRRTGEVLVKAGEEVHREIAKKMGRYGVLPRRFPIKLKVPQIKMDDWLERTYRKDPCHTQEEALKEIYLILRPNESHPSFDVAQEYLHLRLFSRKNYDLSEVGRYQINSRLNLQFIPVSVRFLTPFDLAGAIKRVTEYQKHGGKSDDIDHLGNRRVRLVGELALNALQSGLVKMERMIRDKLQTGDIRMQTPQTLVNTKALMASMKSFFNTGRLTQYLDQTNPLAELTHKRRLSALGPGGLPRERAGFEVRDVHYTHYGKICPIETPEGPNIGLITSTALYVGINPQGFMVTPYLQLEKYAAHDVIDPRNGEVILKKDEKAEETHMEFIEKSGIHAEFRVRVSNKVVFLSANEEDQRKIAEATTPTDEQGFIIPDWVSTRFQGTLTLIRKEEVELIDASPAQIVGISASLIPFLEHDDANRALMGANMLRQAAPIIRPEPPVVGTGMEKVAALYSGFLVYAKKSGTVVSVTGDRIEIKYDGEKRKTTHHLLRYHRSNQGTIIDQQPIVKKGQRVKEGDILVNAQGIRDGELALGRNLLVAFLSLEGFNFEDAIVVNERIVRDDYFTSIHIEDYEAEVRRTRHGMEQVTRDIPHVSGELLKNLDEHGVVKEGTLVKSGDILVGKITPRAIADLTMEEILLRRILRRTGDERGNLKEYKPTPRKLPYGVQGVVSRTYRFEKKEREELPAGVEELVRVFVTMKRKLETGDKLAGRHGNKGVIAKIMPDEDMPYLKDGRTIDLVFSPLCVPSRMNLGQLYETHLAWALGRLGFKVACPVFEGPTDETIQKIMEQADLPPDGKVILYNGMTGKPFDHPVTVGMMYVFKLAHLAIEKIHARSTGTYTLVTQQPLGGKAQFGGQRFGEMEVWALEAYGASETLQELLTVKSDDIEGRKRAYKALTDGRDLPERRIPESLHVLTKELQGLCIDVRFQKKEM